MSDIFTWKIFFAAAWRHKGYPEINYRIDSIKMQFYVMQRILVLEICRMSVDMDLVESDFTIGWFEVR